MQFHTFPFLFLFGCYVRDFLSNIFSAWPQPYLHEIPRSAFMTALWLAAGFIFNV
jgi:hypothetical protein